MIEVIIKFIIKGQVFGIAGSKRFAHNSVFDVTIIDKEKLSFVRPLFIRSHAGL